MLTLEKTCRSCTGSFLFPKGEAMAACPYCGTVNGRPGASGYGLENLARATQQRLRCDFHSAVTSYQHTLLDYPEEHEALWGLALCTYGVEYVDDPRTGKRMPIVHTVRRRPMQLDPNCEEALACAPEDVRALYEDEAKYIDDAMARIIKLSEHGKRYDVFLCHKTTKPGTEEDTEDCKRAFRLYHELTMLGYEVFYAPEEMAGVAAGSDYEAAIYHALETSKVMLLLCSDAEYLTSPWVRSEWMRFLEMADEKPGKCLIPLMYGGFTPKGLPREIKVRKLQGLMMEDLNARSTILSVLEKMCPKDQQKVARAGAPKQSKKPLTGTKGTAAEKAPVPKAAEEAAPKQSKKPSTVTKVTAAEKAPAPKAADEAAPKQSKKPATGTKGTAAEKAPSLKAVGAPAAKSAPRATTKAEPDKQEKKAAPAKKNSSSGKKSARPEPKATSEKTASEQGIVYTPDKYFKVMSWAWDTCKIEGYTGPDTDIFIPPAIGGKKVEGIMRHVFYPDGESGKWSTPQWSVGIVYIPETVKDISDYAFDGVSVREFRVSETNPEFEARDGVLFRKSMFTGPKLIAYPQGKKDQSYAVPSGTNEIGCLAFSHAGNLTEVTIPEGLTGIGENAFLRCKNLKKVQLPDGLWKIGFQAFGDCTALESLTLPKSELLKIDEKAFVGCHSLMVRVCMGSRAHEQLKNREKKQRYELLSPGGQPLEKADVVFYYKKSLLDRLFCRVIRIDGNETKTLLNGESVKFRLTPGVHLVELAVYIAVMGKPANETSRMSFWTAELQAGAHREISTGSDREILELST